jgi:hypothetical protein
MQYSGIRKAYVIVPQLSGDFTVPEVTVAFGYSVDGKKTVGTVTTPSLSFTVAASAPGGQQSTIFAASNLALEQSMNPRATQLKVGDALVRTITITAEDTQAMLMPPVDVETATGLRQYQKPPRIEDGIEANRSSASRRTETYVYTADKQGSFALPAVSYRWFDVSSHEMRTASLPTVTITVAAAVSNAGIKPVLDSLPAEPPHISRQKIALAIGLLLATAALVWLATRLMPVARQWLRSTQQRHHASYRSRLKRLRSTILSGSEAEIYAALHKWSRSLGYATLQAWARNGPDALSAEIDMLSRRLFRAESGQLDRHKLASLVDFRPAHHQRDIPTLPPLNPTGASAA